MADEAEAISFTIVGAAGAAAPQPFAAAAVAANLAKWDLERGAVAIKLRYDRPFNKVRRARRRRRGALSARRQMRVSKGAGA